MLPFTREQFLGVFADYNTAVWPVQFLACALVLAVVAALLRPSPRGHRFVARALAAMWVWTGIAYHALFFARITPVALAFGALFVMQGALFLIAGLAGRRLTFAHSAGFAPTLGWGLVAYAAVLYPMIGQWSGHAYLAQPPFGIAPCPVTLFTFGVMLLTAAPVPRWLLIIPLAWSLVGGSAALMLGVPQDWPLCRRRRRNEPRAGQLLRHPRRHLHRMTPGDSAQLVAQRIFGRWLNRTSVATAGTASSLSCPTAAIQSSGG